jgi:hypothetical protein
VKIKHQKAEFFERAVPRITGLHVQSGKFMNSNPEKFGFTKWAIPSWIRKSTAWNPVSEGDKDPARGKTPRLVVGYGSTGGIHSGYPPTSNR